ncbi:hypothetical protein ACO9S2_17600 [Nitrospira sp. NS4]|uniref:hypothetical protein n=1 Tax=Nitrospira sp. NS4 TaxID=3414498 RepID=UPI003C2C702A
MNVSRGRTMVLYFRPPVLRSIVVLVLLFCPFTAAQAENVAPGAHWGAIDFPDRDRTVIAGFTVNRFTEFDRSRHRFNAIDQTAGFNFATFSWTDRIKALPGWSGNLTFGAGPTSESPSHNIQSFFHHATDQAVVPVDQTRGGGDFMVGGSLTRWSKLFSSRDTGFAGMGVAGGSLYQEVYGRIGVRHLSLAELAAWMLPGSEPELLNSVSRYVRFSAMGRYSRLFGGSAYPSDVITNQSYLGQASVSFADFGVGKDAVPRWQLEVVLTYDSGLFARTNTHMILRRFGSVALHFPYGTFEVWDDWVGSTDSGPTFGYRFMLNLLQLYPLFAGE